MPKTLLFCHAALLLCLSLLMFPSGGAVPRWVAVVATVLAAVFFLTEMLSGLRWPAGVALVAAIVGLFTGGGTPAGAVAWGVAWFAVVGWFVVLASKARENL